MVSFDWMSRFWHCLERAGPYGEPCRLRICTLAPRASLELFPGDRLIRKVATLGSLREIVGAMPIDPGEPTLMTLLSFVLQPSELLVDDITCLRSSATIRLITCLIGMIIMRPDQWPFGLTDPVWELEPLPDHRPRNLLRADANGAGIIG